MRNISKGCTMLENALKSSICQLQTTLWHYEVCSTGWRFLCLMGMMLKLQWWFVNPDTFVPSWYFRINEFSGLLNRPSVQKRKSVPALFVRISEISGLSEPGLTNHHCIYMQWLINIVSGDLFDDLYAVGSYTCRIHSSVRALDSSFWIPLLFTRIGWIWSHNV